MFKSKSWIQFSVPFTMDVLRYLIYFYLKKIAFKIYLIKNKSSF
jgi:hypothetical protein